MELSRAIPIRHGPGELGWQTCPERSPIAHHWNRTTWAVIAVLVEDNTDGGMAESKDSSTCVQLCLRWANILYLYAGYADLRWNKLILMESEQNEMVASQTIKFLILAQMYRKHEGFVAHRSDRDKPKTVQYVQSSGQPCPSQLHQSGTDSPHNISYSRSDIISYVYPPYNRMDHARPDSVSHWWYATKASFIT